MDALLTLSADCTWLVLWLAACATLGLAFRASLAGTGTHAEAPWPNPELALFFTICTGLALHVLVLIVLAVFHLLRPLPVVLALAVLTAGSVWLLARRPTEWHGFAASFRTGPGGWLRVLPILLLILPWILRPLLPPGGSDALTYHLPYARFYLEQGGLAVNETLRFPLHTHNVNLLYAAALIRPGATLAQLLHAAMGFLAMLGVYGIARHWQGWPAAVLAAAGMLLLGEFRYSFSTAFVDNGVLLFVTAAFLALALWSEEGSRRLLWCGALFAGTAMGTKYFGALFAIPLGLMVLWFSRDLKLTARFALAVAGTGLFWYLRSWWISGNPVHPFAGDLFGYWLWTAEELKGQMLELKGHGVERTWLNFLLLPERMFSERLSFNGATGMGGILVGAFMLSCLLLPWQRPAVRIMQLTSLAWLVFWFLSSQVIRYLMLVVPLMSLTAAIAWTGIIARVTDTRGRAGERPVIRSAALGTAALLVSLLLLTAYSVRELRRELPRFPLQAEQREQYLLSRQPSYEIALAAIADPRIGAGPVLQFMLQEIRWFYPGSVYGDWMGKHAFRRYGHIGPSDRWEINHSAALHRQVTEAGIRAVAMSKAGDIQFRPQEIASYRDYFEIVVETDQAVLMVPRPIPPAIASRAP